MKPRIRLGTIRLSFHAASAAVVQRVLERHGYSVVTTLSPQEEIFRRYGAGEVDMIVSAWLPTVHGHYLSSRQEQSRHLGILYEPYCAWGVPGYVPVGEVASVADLARPEIAARMSHLIQGISPSPFMSSVSKEILKQYGLSDLGYYFKSGSGDQCFSRYEKSFKKREWFVVPLWHPQFLHHRFPIRELFEPKGILGGVDKATLLAHARVADTLPLALLTDLTALTLGNRVVSELDDLICRRGLSPLQAADIWLEERARKITYVAVRRCS